MPDPDSKWPLRQCGPGHGAVRLCDLGPDVTTLVLVCEPCGRQDRYRVESLIRTYGPGAGLPDLRHVLAAAGKCQIAVNPPRPCAAVFVREGA